MKNDQSDISEIHLLGAERLNGLKFTHQERELMLSGIIKNNDGFEKLRELRLVNEISPAIYFNPKLPNKVYKSKIMKTKFSDNEIQRPDTNEEIAYLSVIDQAYLIKTKKLTAIELVSIYIQRIKRIDPKIRTVITLLEHHALKEAKKVDEEIQSDKYKGLLHGIPFGAKDLLSYPGYPTTWGATPFKNQIIKHKAQVIEKLEENGAILLAKLSLGALAMGDVWFDAQTMTPWNLDEGARGSSAGSGSATAAGLVSFAIGSETYGSIISPSTRNGISGLRPTFGRVSRYGAMALSWSMDKLGPMCRSVEDLGLVLSAINGEDSRDLSTFNDEFNFDVEFDPFTIKLGYTRTEFEIDRDYKEHDDKTIQDLLDLGFKLIRVELPDFPEDTLLTILFAEAATSFDDITRNKDVDTFVRQGVDAWPNKFREARFIPAVEYIKANRHRFELMQQVDKIFQEVDVYLAPSLGRNLLITNLTGHPSVVIPNGFKENSLPHSISFTGNLFCEGEMLSIAKYLQDHTDYHLRHPSL